MGAWPEGCLSNRQLLARETAMKRRLRLVASLSIVPLIGPVACRDALAPQAQPPAPAPQALLGFLDPIIAKIPILGPLLVPDTVVVLQRVQPLPRDITQAKLIGAWGGQISIPAAGVTLIVPAGAVD